MASGGPEMNPVTCAVCQGNYRDPKFLPCHHTFCGACIQKVADRRHPGEDFPCPACQRRTTLPPGGVTSLPTNFYIQTQNTSHQKPGGQDMCRSHREEKLKLYCAQCDEAICTDCKLTKHERHTTEDLLSAASQKQTELQRDQRRLRRALSQVTETLSTLQGDRQDLDKKRTVVEKQIHNRHALIVAAANRKRDEALRSLQSVHKRLDSNIVCGIKQHEKHQAELCNLLRQLNDAVTGSGTVSDVITVAREMKKGRGSQTAIDAMTSRKDGRHPRPVFQSDVSTEVMTQTVDDYLGRVRLVELKENAPEVKLTERFKCAHDPDPDLEVFSLCHLDRDPPRVWVSCERSGVEKGAAAPPVRAFTETGDCVETGPVVGRVSAKRFAKGRIRYPAPESGWFRTYCKSPTTSAHFRLDNTLSGQAHVNRVMVTSTGPLKTQRKTEFTIQVGLHREFDVDDTENYLAVVEEAKESCRSVLLYSRPLEKAVSAYTPPEDECRVSDVCFYTLGGQKVLLITDEGTDSIHVVSVKGGSLEFVRYLSGRGHLLKQPTAITVDLQGRPWVGCRGGSVLMVEQID